MEAVYPDPRTPGSFGGVERLRRYTRKRRKEVVDYLSGQDAYTLHKLSRRRFARRRTYSKGIADLYQIDLSDLSNLSTHNDGYRYLLNCIDVFTKRAWSVPVKTKTVAKLVMRSNGYWTIDSATWYIPVDATSSRNQVLHE